MRRSRVLAAVILVIVLSVAYSVPATAENESGGGDLMIVDGMPVLFLTGTPAERGMTYGKALAPMVRDAVGQFYESAEGKGMSKAELCRKALAHEGAMPIHMLEEIRAMADASGTDYAALLAMNMFGSSVRDHDGCTIFVAAKSGSESGNTIASKNRDANMPNVLLVVDAIEDRNAFMAVASVGEWGISFGLNEFGLCDGNNWVPVPEFYEGGIDENPLNRMVLEYCASVDESIDYVTSVKKYGGTSVMVADAHYAAFIEAVSSCYTTEDGKDTLWEKIEDGVGVHTNHYTLDPFKSWVVNDEFGYFWVPSVARMDRAYELLEENDHCVDVQDLMSFTRDVDDYANSQPWEIIEQHLDEMPWGTWGFGWPGFSICNTRTVAAGVFEIDGDYPSLMSAMWTAIANPGYTPYFPLHNALLLRSADLVESLSVYVEGTVARATSHLRAGCFDTWIALAPVLTEWESGAVERNADAEAEAVELLDEGHTDGAVSALLNSDTALGLHAYEFILELSS